MLQQIVAYLEKLGYTVEEQGRLEKYLVVFKSGKPVGFILSDLSVKLVSDAEKQDDIRQIIAFIRKNQNLQSVGGSEFIVASFRGNQLTTFFDSKDMLIKFAIYVHDENTGEVRNSTFESYDTAVYRFITQTHMADLDKLLPARETFGEKIRARVIRYLLSKSNSKAEQP